MHPTHFMNQRSRLVAIVCLLIIVTASLGFATLQRAAIQQRMDALPRCDGTSSGLCVLGGVMQLPPGDIQLGSDPLYVGSGVTLRGNAMLATRLIYNGTGPAVRFKSYAGHGYHAMGSVEDLSIFSEKGDGIGIDETTATMEGGGMTVKNVLLNVAGTALKFRKEKGDSVYFVRIERVQVTGAGAGVLTYKGVGLMVDGLIFVNPRRPIVEGFKGAAVQLDGHGAISNSQLEGNWGGPLLHATGTWNFTNNWYEAQRPNEPQIVFDKCLATMDTPMHVMPVQPLLLKNGSTLRVTGSLPFTANGGTPGAPIEQCYLTEDTSQVIHDGQVKVQKR